jgi:hypothetical protein
MPVEGMTAYVRSTSTQAIYRGGSWEVSGGPIASPSGGATVDAQARLAIDQIIDALQQHGLIAS